MELVQGREEDRAAGERVIMSGQIVFVTDPIGNANPFGNVNVSEFCFNASEWLVQQQQFREVALQLGYFALVVGFLMGLVAGYYYCKRKYGSKD